MKNKISQTCAIAVLALGLAACPIPVDVSSQDSSPYGAPVPQMTAQGATLRPIGYFETPYTPATGAPRQGVLRPQSRAEIAILPAYQDALKDLKQFEYVWVLYYFNQVKGWRSEVRPPKSRHHFGLFATRSPKRPNPIGLSLIKIEKIENGRLFVSGIDAFDKTPVLDIKPYLPSIDIVDSVKNRQTEKDLGHHDQDFIYDPTMFH